MFLMTQTHSAHLNFLASERRDETKMRRDELLTMSSWSWGGGGEKREGGNLGQFVHWIMAMKPENGRTTTLQFTLCVLSPLFFLDN